ncbi:MAG: putative metallopeptidase [Candidatus Pacearchaeota archaeon]|nr:putative metallopeptidase [Candidatus Pacearchaeota archaeon]
MKYEPAPDLQKIAEEISHMLFPHVKLDRVKCFRSYGSSSRGTIARCHTIGKLMQEAMNVDAHYALEFISERFDDLSDEEKIKVVIHELMHIPMAFGGGFRHHDHVCEKNVNICYRTYKEKRKELDESDVLGIKELKWKNSDNLKSLKDIKKHAEKGFF